MTLDRPLRGPSTKKPKQPLHALKTFAQDGRRLPANPAVWYRGWTAGALMCVPMTVVQFGTTRRLERLFASETQAAEEAATGRRADGLEKNDAETRASTPREGTRVSPAARFAAALIAGGVSGACAQPLDLCMTQQQKFGGSLVETARRIANAPAGVPGEKSARGLAPFARGARLTVAREALFTAAVLGAVPSLREARPDLPLAAGAVAAGLGAAVLTQPLDTVKTVMQSNLESDRAGAGAGAGPGAAPKRAPAGGPGAARLGGLGYRDTAAALVNEGGVLSLWRGLVPRGARVVGATFILSFVNERAGEAVAGWRGDAAAAEER